MGLRIQNNLEAFNTHRQLQISSAAASSSMEKLSSGYRINRAADDAAGLAISEQMRGQIGGLAQAQRNAQDGVSLVQTAEGSLNEVHSMLQRLRDLKVQFNNGTLDSSDQDAIADEVYQIGKELGDIASQTSFNGNKLLGGATFTFQVGANDGEVEIRLDHRLNNLATYQETLTASESRIRDVDMAAEMTTYTKENILQQAGTSMLAQANQTPQLVLSLLRG